MKKLMAAMLTLAVLAGQASVATALQRPDEQRMQEMMDRARRNGGQLELSPQEAQEFMDQFFKDFERAPFGMSPRMRGMMEEMFGRGLRPGERQRGELQQGELRQGELPQGRVPDNLMPPGYYDRLMRGRGGRSENPGEFERTHASQLDKYKTVTAKAAASTVRVLAGQRQVALGTAIDENLVVTKASELQLPVTIKTKNQTFEAEVIGVHEPYDLALLQVEGAKLPPITWNREATTRGTLVAAPDAGAGTVAAGIISVETRKPFKPKAFLGIATDQADNGVVVAEIIEDTAASECGLNVGDVIQKINGKQIKTVTDLLTTIADYQPGDAINIDYQRDNEAQQGTAILGTRAVTSERMSRFEGMNAMSGPRSRRRTEFPQILQTDVTIIPNECGGPLVDLSGRAVGVNIARVGRVESYAVPVSELEPVLAELKSGDLKPSEDFGQAVDDETSQEMEAIRSEIERLQRRLRQLERGRSRNRR